MVVLLLEVRVNCCPVSTSQQHSVSIVATEHLVSVFEGPALGLGQHDSGEQRAGESESEQRERATIADPVGQRTLCVGAGGTGHQTDEATDGCRDAAKTAQR